MNSPEIFERRFIDETDAWFDVYKQEERILSYIGRARVFCEIRKENNVSTDGGFYMLLNGHSRPLLTALVWRDVGNWTILQMVSYSERIEELKKRKNKKDIKSD